MISIFQWIKYYISPNTTFATWATSAEDRRLLSQPFGYYEGKVAHVVGY